MLEHYRDKGFLFQVHPFTVLYHELKKKKKVSETLSTTQHLFLWQQLFYKMFRSTLIAHSHYWLSMVIFLFSSIKFRPKFINLLQRDIHWTAPIKC
jgi:hypothetical protein